LCRVYPQKLSIWETGIFGNFSVGGGEFCHFKTGIPGGPGSDVTSKRQVQMYRII